MIFCMASKLVVGNWKMNLDPESGGRVLSDFQKAAGEFDPASVAFCVPFPLISPLQNHGVNIGAQDVFWLDSGAFTGFTSPDLLAKMGVEWIIVGHSERRGRFGKLDVPESTLPFFAETDETVNLKVKACERHGLRAIVCVGETLAERDAGKTDEIVSGQVRRALDGVATFHGVLAYEPVWAIGTGKTCDPDEAARVCGLVWQTSEGRTCLYGGSVSAANAADLFARDEIGGGLVGGASLKPADFAAIVGAAQNR